MSLLGFSAPAATDTDAVVTLADARAPQPLTVIYSLDANVSTRFVVNHGGVDVEFLRIREDSPSPFTYHYDRWTPGAGELKFTLEAAVGAKGTVRVESREDT